MAATNVASLAIKITGNSTSFLRSLRGISAPLTGLARKLSRINNQRAFRGASRDATSFGDTLYRLARGASRARSAITAIGAVGVASVGGVVALAKTALDISGGFEQAKIALSVLLRSASKGDALFQTLLKFSAATPFAFEDILQSTRQLLAFGIAEDQILPSLKAVGELSASTGTSLKELAFVYGQTRAELRLYSRDIKQFTTKGIPLIRELARIKGVTESQVFDLAEKGQLLFPDVVQAFKDLTEKGGQFSGGIAKQAASLKGLQVTLSDSIKIMFGKVGDELVKKFDLKNYIAGLIRQINAKFDPLSASLANLITSVGRITLAVVGAFSRLVDLVLRAVEVLSETFAKFFKDPGMLLGGLQSDKAASFFASINKAFGGSGATDRLSALDKFLFRSLDTFIPGTGATSAQSAQRSADIEAILRQSEAGGVDTQRLATKGLLGEFLKLTTSMANLGKVVAGIARDAAKPELSFAFSGHFTKALKNARQFVSSRPLRRLSDIEDSFWNQQGNLTQSAGSNIRKHGGRTEAAQAIRDRQQNRISARATGILLRGAWNSIKGFSAEFLGPSSYVTKLLGGIGPLKAPNLGGGKNTGSLLAKSLSPVAAIVEGEGGFLAALQRSAQGGGGGSPLLSVAKEQLRHLRDIKFNLNLPRVASIGSP